MNNTVSIDVGEIAEFTLKNFPAGYAGVIPIEIELEEGELWVEDPAGYEMSLDDNTRPVTVSSQVIDGKEVKLLMYTILATDFPADGKSRYVVYINNKTKELQYRTAIKLIVEPNESKY